MGDNGQQQHVPPAPTNVTVEVRRIASDQGEQFCLLVLHTPTGSHVTFWQPEKLAGLARTLLQASTGIIVPGPE